MKMNMKLPFSFAVSKDFKLFIQHKVWIGCIYALFTIPSVLFILHIFHIKSEFGGLRDRIENLQLRMERIKTLQKDRNAFILQYGDVDPNYIENVLEPMQLLASEVDALELVYSHPAFQACDNVKKRLDTLTKGSNRLVFSEKNKKIENGIEEIEYTQMRPVEINVSDLKTILAAIEGIQIEQYQAPAGQPQFIVRNFHLNKKKLAERETYLLEMQLIKRGIVK